MARNPSINGRPMFGPTLADARVFLVGAEGPEIFTPTRGSGQNRAATNNGQRARAAAAHPTAAHHPLIPANAGIHRDGGTAKGTPHNAEAFSPSAGRAPDSSQARNSGRPVAEDAGRPFLSSLSSRSGLRPSSALDPSLSGLRQSSPLDTLDAEATRAGAAYRQARAIRSAIETAAIGLIGGLALGGVLFALLQQAGT